MSIIFNGREYSEKKKLLLKSSADRIRELGIIPHLATIFIGNDKASELYVGLKKKFIESLGCQVDIYKLKSNVSYKEIKLLLDTLNDDTTVHGIMIQFPLPNKLLDKKNEIINLISSEKDVDGLREGSKFLHPTAKAVLEILAMAVYETKKDIKSVCVVGSKGMVGRPLVKEFKKLGYVVHECDKETKDLKDKTLSSDVVVSSTGIMNLITYDMVCEDSIVIDVGSPFGDVSESVEGKASFITPVPGGVGPVTITCLAENLILASNS